MSFFGAFSLMHQNLGKNASKFWQILDGKRTPKNNKKFQHGQ